MRLPTGVIRSSAPTRSGARWVPIEDAIGPQKEAACRALRAQQRFAKDGPPDAPQLPLSYGAREKLKVGGLPHVVALYARSLEALDYDVDEHPSFDEYAGGVMASSLTPAFIRNDPDLLKR